MRVINNNFKTKFLGLSFQLSALLFSGVIGQSVSAAENCTAAPVSGEVYSIINLSSGKSLDINGRSTANGANVIQWDYWGGTNQQFNLTDLGNGYWSILPVHSGRSLDVYAWSQANGGKIAQWDYLGGTNQQWALKHSSTGAFNIVSRFSRKSLTVPSSDNGAQVYQNDDVANGSQRWYLNPVSIGCAGTDVPGSGSNPNPNPNPAPSGSIIGFASQAGNDGLSNTTGGGNATPVTVTSCSALSAALTGSNSAVVQIPNNTTIDCRTTSRSVAACAIACPSYQDSGKTFYRLPVPGQSCLDLGASSNNTVNRTRNETVIRVRSNKTLIGLGSNSKVVGANFYLQDVKNVIIRNLAIENINPGLIEAGDGISLNNTSHIWLDHLSFSLISDGHIDMYDSNNVTISWNRFKGENPAVCGNKHHYTQLVQNSQVTLHHNAYLNISGRNPKIDGSESRAHLFNNFWKNVTYFSIGVGDYAQAKVEANYFENAVKPHWDTGNGYIDAGSSNRYTGSSASDPDQDSGAYVFGDVNMYPYRLDDVNSVPDLVNNNAGPR